MPNHISPLAEVAPQARLGNNVSIGPFCLVGPDVELGDGCQLDSHVVIVGHTEIGSNNRFFPHCVIGGEPQDLGYQGAPTRLVVGHDNTFREGVTVSRGAEKEDHVTRIGARNLFMANSHIAHNCHVHDGVVLVNGVLLGGHVHVYDGAIVSGGSAVHHFGTIGTLAFVAGCSRVTTDVPPYMMSAGNETHRIVAPNIVGLQRKGVSAETIGVLRRAHRLLYREHRKLDDAREVLSSELAGCFPIELIRLLDFVEKQHAGKQGRQGEVRRNKPPENIEVSKAKRRAA